MQPSSPPLEAPPAETGRSAVFPGVNSVRKKPDGDGAECRTVVLTPQVRNGGRDLRLGYGFSEVPQVQGSLKPDKPQVRELLLHRSHISILTKTAANRKSARRRWGGARLAAHC